MLIDFARSERGTVGLEWELALIDERTGDLVPRAEEVLDALAGPDGSPHPHITGELLKNTVELVTGIHRTIPGAIAQLRELRAELDAVTAPRGIAVISSGSHPFAQWFDQPVTEKDRYAKLIERTRWWGRNMMIWGVHVHVGIEDRDKVLPLTHALIAYSPHLQALSASSPFWGGVDTGYASNRALMFQQLPTAGLPYPFREWSEFESYVADLTRTDVIADHTEIRWDARPSPHWGTLEMRSCDAASTAHEFAAIAALIHCLVEYHSSRLDRGEPIPALPAWFERENKWRAARYGLEARAIVDEAGTQRDIAEHLLELVDTLAPTAERLGCGAELATIPGIIRDGASYQRQLRVAAEHNGDLRAVVFALARELRADLPTPALRNSAG